MAGDEFTGEGDHLRRVVDAGDALRPLGQLSREQAVPAADVQRIAAFLGDGTENAWVPGDVSVPVGLRVGLAHRIIVGA